MQFPCRSTLSARLSGLGKELPCCCMSQRNENEARYPRYPGYSVHMIFWAPFEPGRAKTTVAGGAEWVGGGGGGLKDCVPVARTLEMALCSDQFITFCKQLKTPRWSKHESVFQAFEPRQTVHNLVDSSRWSVAPGLACESIRFFRF